MQLNFEKSIECKNIGKHSDKALSAIKSLASGKCEMAGWVKQPFDYDKAEFENIIKIAEEIKKTAETLVVIGIGGSYLGAKAAIDFLSEYYERKGVEVIFAGNSLSEKYLKETLDYVEKKNFYINVVSKSGGTLEPYIAFEKFKELCKKKYGDDYKNRIIATTDKEKGNLKAEANREGYRTLVVPDNIGGRYSVMSAVGLLPIASAGFDIFKILEGAREGYEKYTICDIEKNDALKYACLRNIYYNSGKDIEVFSSLNPNMRFFHEWLKQLFGESECKDHKGIFPAALTFTADLHSMGQLMQDGKRNLFETFIIVEDDYCDTRVNYNEKYTINDINNKVSIGAENAHFMGSVPIIEIKIKKQTEKELGMLFYFFMIACAVSAIILGVNPFDQPGVEVYKKEVKELIK